MTQQEPTPTVDLTASGYDLLSANAQFWQSVDFPTGVRMHSLRLAIDVDGQFTFMRAKDEDEAIAQRRILDRARAFEAYLRGDQ